MKKEFKTLSGRKCVYGDYLEKDVKEFIKVLKEDLCLNGETGAKVFCNDCVMCNTINEEAGEDLI